MKTLYIKPGIEKTHICCELMTGEVFNFDEMCNQIDTVADGVLIQFMAVNNKTGKGIYLAVIPVANIKKIVYMHTQEHIDDILGKEE